MPNKTRFMGALALVSVMVAMPASADPPAKAGPSDAELIQSAMSAGPAAISQHATIVAMDSAGKMRTLRKGNNGFTCMPDDPGSPGPDPMCLDANSMQWLHAWLAKKPPTPNKVGFIYMLAGGSDASNTDPYAGPPRPPQKWITTGPHVMVVGADPSFYEQYPKGPDPDTSVPYVMWAGTPYQHLMAPSK